ncbi:MAG: hypothetical protein K6E19_11225 [Lachnospiraceae bacterium]|nr:hypothetical protein [Lachnospiraceae bacterium]
MEQLLIIRDKIKVFAGKNEAWLLPLFKFLMTFILMLRINSRLGYMTRLTGLPIAMIVALAGSFLPINLTIVILGAIVIAHIYKISLMAAGVVLALFMVLFLLYYRFASKDAVGTMLMQVAYVFNIPAFIPVSMGLTGTPVSMVSVGSGVIVHYVLAYIADHAKELSSTAEADSVMTSFKGIVDAIIGNKEMYVMAAAYAVTVLVVYVIRRLPVDFCWYIAIGAGSLACFFVTLVGNGALHTGIAMGPVFVGVLISVIFNIILQFFCFSLDYNKTERVQFEDDEYYYYVKAVPKRGYGIRDNVIRPASRKRQPPQKVVVKTKASAPVRRRSEAASQTKAPVRRPVEHRIPKEDVVMTFVDDDTDKK